MKTNLLILFAAITATNLSAKAQSCNCRKSAINAIEVVQQSYAGFAEKTKAQTVAYTRLHNTTIEQAGRSTDTLSCLHIIKKYLDFFKDGHLNIRLAPIIRSNGDLMQQMIKKLPAAFLIKTPQQEPGIKKTPVSPLCGIWVKAGTDKTIQIKQAGKTLYAVVLHDDEKIWKQGQLRFVVPNLQTQTMQFINNDRTVSHLSYRVFDNTYLKIYSTGYWIRFQERDSYFPDGNEHLINESLSFKKLSADACYLGIPDFSAEHYPATDSLIQANEQQLYAAKYLLLDLRNNPGGYIFAFNRLLPLIAKGNRPIQYGYQTRASKRNIQNFRYFLYDSLMTNENKLKISKIIAGLEKATGDFADFPADSINYTPPQDFLYNPNQQIFILTNERTASAAEIFILMAKANPRVRICGIATAGEYVFVDIGHAHLLHCNAFYLACPMTRSGRASLSANGHYNIAPDMPLPMKEADWVDYLVKEFVKNN